MARRASLPTLPPPSGLPQGPASAPRLSTQHGTGLTGLGGGAPGETRNSSPPAYDGVSMVAASQLLDRLSAADEAPFTVAWIESLTAGRTRMDPTLAVRLLRAYRETGRIAGARELAASLPPAPAAWSQLDTARLCIERAIVAMIDGRPDHTEGELRGARRARGPAPRGRGLREQLDIHLTAAQLDIRRSRIQPATAALRLAEHVAER